MKWVDREEKGIDLVTYRTKRLAKDAALKAAYEQETEERQEERQQLRAQRREYIKAGLSTLSMYHGVSLVEILDILSDMVMDNISSHEASGELRRVQ